MNELSRAERFKKCLNCGSEEHRAKDCKAGKAEPKAPDHNPSVQAATTSSSQPVVQATPVLNSSPGFEAVGGPSTAQRRRAPCTAASTSAGRLEYCIAAAPSATCIGCARIVCTQSFGQEARYPLSRARELFPGFGSPKPEFPTPSSGSPN